MSRLSGKREIMKVIAFKPNPRKPEQGFVRFEDETEAWTPEIAKAAELVGKELPDGWTLRDGPKGKQLLPPKEGRGGGQTAFRNTKEAFLLEQASIHASVALQQAVILLTSNTKDSNQHFGGDIEAWTKRFYYLLQSVSEGPPAKASVSAAGESLIERGAQGPPSDTISGEVPDPLHSTEGVSPDERREGDAGDSTVGGGDTLGAEAVTPRENVQTPGSLSRRRCLHTEGIKTITRETGGAIDVCIRCGAVVVA
jgi:hypothetical protein